MLVASLMGTILHGGDASMTQSGHWDHRFLGELAL